MPLNRVTGHYPLYVSIWTLEGNGQVRSSARRALDHGRRGACLGSISWGLPRVVQTMRLGNKIVMESSDYNRSLVGRMTHYLSVV